MFKWSEKRGKEEVWKRKRDLNIRRRLDVNSSTESTSNLYADDSTLQSNSSFGENFEMEDEYDFHDPNVTELEKIFERRGKSRDRNDSIYDQY